MPKSESDDLEGPAKIMAERFIQRWDLYALQSRDGRYVCVHKPLTTEKVCSHLRGEATLGTYVLTPESKARFTVFDFDAPDSWPTLLKLTTRLILDGIPAYLEQSRRGGHLWCFFAEPVNSREVRRFSIGLQTQYKFGECEIFPKQDHLLDGPGSLIRLPFGIHRLTGQRYAFYKAGGEVLGDTIRKQIASLKHPLFVPRKVFQGMVNAYPGGEGQTDSQPSMVERKGKLSERIKSHMTVHEFIGKYVELQETDSGAIGKCPFHEDQHPSLGINDQDNYWHCFAGCGGGSIIDFWSKWREAHGQDGSFVATITELAELLF